jgi:hypothetical protein
MHWRNRLYKLTKEEIPPPLQKQSTVILGKSAISLFPSREYEDELILNDNIFPENIIAQVNINPAFYENNETFVKAGEKATPFCLYEKSIPLLHKALSKISLEFEAFIPESSTSSEWINLIEPETTLLAAEFDVLSNGTYIWEEKRSPQEGIPEQSLWSYGGTYTPDFDVCQVIQTKFFPIIIDGKTTIRTFKSKKSLSILDSIQNGAIKILKKDQNKNFYYQSFFIKSLSHKKAHIHFKKVRTEVKELS